MPNPNLTYVEVRGTYTSIDGSPEHGRISFRPRAELLVDQTGLTTATSRAFVVDLDATGSFAIDLPATDDPDLVPLNFTYHVQEFFRKGRSFDMSVPSAAAATGIDITTTAPVDPDAGTSPGFVFATDPNDSDLAGVTVMVGRGDPLPSAAEHPNTIYIVVP